MNRWPTIAVSALIGLMIPVLVGCRTDLESCSQERCDVWICGEPRPDCPCGDLCERPECSVLTVYVRDPDGSCFEYASQCDIPEERRSWEFFLELDLCETDVIMCSSTSECYEGEVCDLSSCALDAVGVCVERPESCPDTDEPVFDCAGELHSNDCERLRAGARLGGLATIVGSECTGSGVWARDPLSGACSYYGGSCYAPEGWPYFFTRDACEGPICSSSSVFYYDVFLGDCVEASSDCDVPPGVEFFSRLEQCSGAANRCGGTAGSCPSGMFCSMSGCDVVTGECVPLPDECLTFYETTASMVCGCDGLTYTSDCERLIAGVALAYLGQCGAQ